MKLSKEDKLRLKYHSIRFGEKHVKEMRGLMINGDSFNEAHNKVLIARKNGKETKRIQSRRIRS